jgi:hypothetical protein
MGAFRQALGLGGVFKGLGSRVQGSGLERERGVRKTCSFYRDLNLIGNILLVRINRILDNIRENQL